MTSPTPEVIDLASHRAFPVSKEHGRVINPFNVGKQEAFVAGAEWLMKWKEKNLWHPGTQMPTTMGKFIIVKPLNSLMLPAPQIVFTADEQTTKTYLGLKNPCIWAYLDDFLPERISQ